MHKQLVKTPIWVILFLCTTVLAQSVEEKVVVKEMVGKVEVRPSGAPAWRAARAGMPVKMGWDIRTYVESSADLQFASGTILKVSENSVVTMSTMMVNAKAGVSNSSVKVATGHVLANVKKLTGSKSSFDFETPTAVASIRGTVLDIKIGKDGDQINVHEGTVMVRRRGGGQEVAVTAGRGAVVPKQGTNIQLVTIAATIVPPADSVAVPADSAAAPTDSAAAQSDSAAASAADSTRASDSSAATSSAAPADSVPAAPAVPVDSVAPPANQGDTTAKQTDVDPAQQVPPPAGDTLSATSPQQEKADTIQERSALQSAIPLTLRIQEPAQGAIVSEPTIIVKGSAVAGARVTISGDEATVGADGGFSHVVDLKIGANTIVVEATLGTQQRKIEGRIEYRPELYLNVNNLVDGMLVTSPSLRVDLEVTEGARYSVNGRSGVNTVELSMGENTVVVRAIDRWNNSLEQSFRVVMQAASGFILNVTKPSDNMIISDPMIPVSGNTVAGAKVTVRNSAVQVNAGGYFSTQLPIPDEPREYSIVISATLGDEERIVERTVTYRPMRKPLNLDITSPAEGQLISVSPLRIQGLTAAGAKVSINGRPATGLSPSGAFTHDLSIAESQIGDLTLEILAWYPDDGINDLEELSVSRTVQISVASPKINTSKPTLRMSGISTQGASKDCNATLQVSDLTPGDEISLEIVNNGSRENLTLDPGGRESFCFEDGKNTYSIRAFDKARNVSSTLTGEMYVLPGPLAINVIEPRSESVTIDDLPPMPRGVPVPKMTIKVQIDDGIGNVPETIKFVRIVETGALLTDNKNYEYSTTVSLQPKRLNMFTVQTEDSAGNKAIKQITIDMRQ